MNWVVSGMRDTYAVRFLLPFGWRSPSAAGVGSPDPNTGDCCEATGGTLLLRGELGCSSRVVLGDGAGGVDGDDGGDGGDGSWGSMAGRLIEVGPRQ